MIYDWSLPQLFTLGVSVWAKIVPDWQQMGGETWWPVVPNKRTSTLIYFGTKCMVVLLLFWVYYNHNHDEIQTLFLLHTKSVNLIIIQYSMIFLSIFIGGTTVISVWEILEGRTVIKGGGVHLIGTQEIT